MTNFNTSLTKYLLLNIHFNTSRTKHLLLHLLLLLHHLLLLLLLLLLLILLSSSYPPTPLPHPSLSVFILIPPACRGLSS